MTAHTFDLFAFGKTGGVSATEHTIICNTTGPCQVPEHNHSMSSNGNHTHEVTIMTQNNEISTSDTTTNPQTPNNHAHNISLILNDNNFNSRMNYSFIAGKEPETEIKLETNVASHNHVFRVNEGGKHDHEGSTGYDKSTDATPINIEPNNMKLVYIIKVI